MTKILIVVGVMVCIAVTVACVAQLVYLRKRYYKALHAHYEACCLKYQFGAALLDYARCYGSTYITEDDEAVKAAIDVMGYGEEEGS